MLPEVTFRGLAPSPSVVEAVWKKTKRLTDVAPQLGGCHVVIEAESRGQRRHPSFRVVVHLTGGTSATRRGARHATSSNVHVALRDAFDAARRQLETRSKHARGRGHAAELAMIH